LINVFQPSLGEAELAAVREVFASSWIGRGAITARFETEFAAHLAVGERLVRSVSCCTEGLFQAVELLRIGPGDEVVLPSISFVGAANAVAARGARPVFCDVDPRTLNATPAAIEPLLTPRTRAVLLLHYGGVPTALPEILELLRTRGIPLVEDAACSVASKKDGRALGTFGDIGVWSFDSMKILVTGDGGMVYCRDPELAERLARSVYLGMDEGSGRSSTRATRWWEFEIDGFGRRAIMNDMASAIGLVQLKRLAEFVARRRQIHDRYLRALEGAAWLTPPPRLEHGVESSHYFFWLQCEPGLRDRLAAALRERDIYTTFRYHPLHRVKAYGHQGGLPGAEAAAERTLCLPIHQGLSTSDQDKVIDAVLEFGKDI
jgi:dTDP-4-amino-4,6-dideoxygalactose transaminase